MRNIGNKPSMIRLSVELNFTGEPASNQLEHPLILLLESVNETGSIGKAAKNLGLSYRHIWGGLKHWETELNTNLIIWGKTGKGATLTPEALQFLFEMAQTQLDLQRQVKQIKKRIEKCVCVLKNSRTAHLVSH
jgi:putative molybdopterin biosynthesis protein